MIILIIGNSQVGKKALAQGLKEQLSTCYNTVIVNHVIARLKERWSNSWGFDPDSKVDRAKPVNLEAPGAKPYMTWGDWMLHECRIRGNSPVARLRNVLAPAMQDAIINAREYNDQIITGVRYCDELETLVNAAHLLDSHLIVFSLMRKSAPETSIDRELVAVQRYAAELMADGQIMMSNLCEGTDFQFLHWSIGILRHLGWLSNDYEF